MMEIPRFFYVLTCAASLALFACGNDTNTDENAENANDSIVEESPAEEGKVVYYGTPSLVEVASIMKSSGATFTDQVLNNPANRSSYSTQYAKALNIGVYGADLTYSAIFDQTQESINYLKTIKLMSEELGMMGAFETDLLNKIESNITNRDSLLNIITDFYWSADAYLMDNERMEVACLIVTGGWIESMYIACHMANNSPKNKEIKHRIAEQKLMLKNLILFLQSTNQKDAGINDVTNKLTELNAVYSQIKVSQDPGNNVTNEKKGETVIEGSTDIVVSQEQLTQLCNKITEIRTSFVK